MATSNRPLDSAALESELFAITRGLLEELGNRYALDAVRSGARLDRDLGLGSLDRVELMVRIDRVLGTHLPEKAMAEAETLDDVIAAIGGASGATAPGGEAIHEEPRAEPEREASPSDATGDALASAETWQEVLRYRARADAGRTHLILLEEGAERRITFAELYESAAAVAAGLAHRGVTRGDAVALMLPTGREFFVTFAGVLLAGAVPVPMYPPVRADRIAEYAARQSAILRNAEARVLVTFREASRVASLLRPSVPSLRDVATAADLLAPLEKDAAPAVASRGSGNDLALLQYTSGSTGDPKGVMLTHANLLASVRAMGEAIRVRPGDVAVSWLPLYHDMGLIGTWLGPLYFGLSVAVLSPLAFLVRPVEWLRALARYRGTFTAGPNFAFELVLRKLTEGDTAGLDLSAVRAMMNGAEPVDPNTLERFAKRLAPCGLRREALMPVYGLAEASLAVAIPSVDRGPRVDRVERDTFEREHRAVPVSGNADGELDDASNVTSFVSVGQPIPRHSVRIVDAEGRDAPERVEGRLWFSGPATTQGYFRNEEASRKLFPAGQASGWLDSGDRAYRADGDIFITGRVKDIILMAGRNLYPHEVEELAARTPGVRRGCVAALGVTDRAAGTERLVVVAETREREAAAQERIRAGIREEVLRGVGVPPDAVELVSPHSIPKTSSGKLRRDETRRLYLTGALGAAVAPPWVQVARLGAAGAVRTSGRWARRALEKAYGVYALAAFFAVALPLWLIVMLTPSRRAAQRVASAGFHLALALAGCRMRVTGREHIGSGAKVLVSNHTSYIDVVLLTATLGADYHFVAKIEVLSMPLVGGFMRKLGHFAFDRNDPQARLRQSEEMEDALRRGESVFVFPEGTFTRQEGLRPFHLGAFKSAADILVPIVPVALRGTRQFLRDGTWLPRPVRMSVTVCPPIEPRETSAEARWREVVRLRDATREAISAQAGEPLL